MVKTSGVAAALLIATLAGCSVGGALPQDAKGVAPAPTDPALTTSDTFLVASDGSDVAASTWAADEPKAVILALHGFGDYGASTFESVATYWARAGITTIAPDQRGFGRNPSRGRWPGAGALVADANDYVAQVRARFPCVPLVLLGHSMGGGVALASAPSSAPDALILAAPAIWGGANLNPLLRALSWGAAAVVPERRLSGRGVVRIQASDNIEALRALGQDPLYLSPPSAREILGLVRITDLAAAAAPNAIPPALMLLGAQDQIVPNQAVRAVFQTYRGDAEVIEYAEGWHLLFRDLQAERVWKDTTRFALAAKPSQECPT